MGEATKRRAVVGASDFIYGPQAPPSPSPEGRGGQWRDRVRAGISRPRAARVSVVRGAGLGGRLSHLPSRVRQAALSAGRLWRVWTPALAFGVLTGVPVLRLWAPLVVLAWVWIHHFVVSSRARG